MPVTQFVRDLNARRIATICPRSNSFRMLGRHNIKCTTLSLFDRMGLLRTHSRRSFEWTLFSGDKGMSRLLEQVPNQVLNAQASAQLQAEPYTRSDDHHGYQNGTRLQPLTHRSALRDAIFMEEDLSEKDRIFIQINQDYYDKLRR